MGKHQDLTQKYSTWGDKLLQHTDVLSSIQYGGKFSPITVQVALGEPCDSDCPFCSVSGRPLKSKMTWQEVRQTLNQFSLLGAKSVELTGGGNPMLWNDAGIDINNVVDYAVTLGLEVGIITNSHDLSRLDDHTCRQLSWVRVSLIKLEEGKKPRDYKFGYLPYDKLAFSYIIYDGTTVESIQKIAELVKLHPEIKFVRLAGDCLEKGANEFAKQRWSSVIDAVDEWGKFFMKDIGNDDGPFNDGCYVGALRPYVAPAPDGSGYNVYTCTSHVLNTRTYDPRYALCGIEDIITTWEKMNDRFKETGHPYEVDGNGGKDWCDTCKFCYYQHNNKLIHTVAHEMPDRNFA